MKTIEGHFLDGLHPVALQASISFVGRHVTVTAGDTARRYEDSQLSVSPRIARADRFVSFPDGTQFVCGDHPVLDILPQESASEGPVAWLEARWKVALACVAAVILALLACYRWGLPALAERIAEKIPMETEQALGAKVLAWFDEQNWLTASDLDASTHEKLRDGFYRLCADLPYRDYYRLEFRSSRFFGPNAFALPGAIVVVTDDLVELSETDEEVLAVMAHEIGHVEHRHATRSVLQNSVVAAAVATVTADAATLSVAVAGLPMVLARTKYSREFETAADDFAFRLLQRNGHSPEAFAAIMERLAAGRSEGPSRFNYLSTHPVTKERVRRAREQSGLKHSRTREISGKIPRATRHHAHVIRTPLSAT
jgi:predicted Zn-dependent protease